MIDCQLITYINYCLTHYLMSNLIAKAKADAEADRAKAEADLSAKMKAQPSDFASDDSSKEEDDTQAFIATLNANTNKILAEDEKKVDGIFKSPIEETATPNEETATPDLSMDVSDDEAAAKAKSVLDLFPPPQPPEPAMSGTKKSSKSSSKKKGSSSKHTYAKEIENTRSQRPNTRSQRAQNEPQAVETPKAERAEKVGRAMGGDDEKSMQKQRKVIYQSS